MFLLQLSSSVSSFLPRSLSSSCSLHLLPACRPCRPRPRRPPWPPPPPRTSSGRTSQPLSVAAGYCRRPFSVSAALTMERHDRDRDRDREPPHKRRRSTEEARSDREKEGHRGGGGGGREKGGGLQDGCRERGRNGAAKDVWRENSSDAERTKTGIKGRQRRDSDGGAQTAKPEPRPAPNPWFRGRDAGGAERQVRGGRDGAQWAELPSNPRQPPPPGTRLPETPGRPLQRHWEGLPVCQDGAAFDFSVMSYNILSQQLLQDNAYLYHHCAPGVLRWEHRLPNLLREIQQHSADILCLQEVQEDHYENQIKPALQALGYQCEYKRRTGRKPDGCAVIFKSSRLSLLSSNPIEYFRPGDALLDRDNVGLVVLLRPNHASASSDPSAVVCVANTHLLYNPRRGDVKLAQLAILLAEVSRLSRLQDGSTCPVLLCGDFNSTPRSPLYSFLTTGSLEYRGLQIGMVSGQESSPRPQRFLSSPLWSSSLGIDSRCQFSEPPSSGPSAVEGAISNLTVRDDANKAAPFYRGWRIEHGLKLQSSYQHCLVPDGRPEITTCHSRTAMTVDYILYTPEFTSLPGGRGLQLLGRLSLVGQSELEEVNGLPNQHHSSDHLPLVARFRLGCLGDGSNVC